MVEYVIADGARAVRKGGINVGDFEFRTFVVTGHAAFQQRTKLSNVNASTRTHLLLDLRRDAGESDRPVTLAHITFGAHSAEDTHKIGKIAKRPPPNARQFELDVTLPAAEFDHYWKILTQEKQPHLRCVIVPTRGTDIEDFTLATTEFQEGQGL